MKPTDTGMNRTGAGMSPKDSKAMAEAARKAVAPPGDESAIARMREAYFREADAVGTVPPPTSVKGAAKTAGQLLAGKKPTVLLDKLGERLAFERTGHRLYEAAIAKLAAAGGGDGIGITAESLRGFQREELEHMQLVVEALQKLGADPTTETPGADVSGVQAIGILQVLTDPRTTVAQCLEALLTAELVDNASWEMLIDLCREMGRDDFVPEFERALREEALHLSTIRGWLRAFTTREAHGQAVPT